jgi:hypothetical protein
MNGKPRLLPQSEASGRLVQRIQEHSSWLRKGSPALLATDILAVVRSFSIDNPSIVLLGLIISAWTLFAAVARDVLIGLAALDLAVIRHRTERRRLLAKLPDLSHSVSRHPEAKLTDAHLTDLNIDSRNERVC